MSADEEEGDQAGYDELSLLPANKRRKLQQLSRSQKKVELVRQTVMVPQHTLPLVLM